MRIGYVLKKFPRISETFILNEILELTRQGCEVTVFSLHKPDDGLFHQKLSDLTQPVVYVPVRKTGAQLAFCYLCHRMTHLVREAEVDVPHVPMEALTCDPTRFREVVRRLTGLSLSADDPHVRAVATRVQAAVPEPADESPR